MNNFIKIILFTDIDGRAKFKEEEVPLDEGTPQTQLTKIFSAKEYQLRFSPIGFRSQFHVTRTPLWIFVLTGKMEIGLQDGTTRIFHPGDHFFASDTLPEGETFDSLVHGHWSRQVGEEPLRTLSVIV